MNLGPVNLGTLKLLVALHALVAMPPEERMKCEDEAADQGSGDFQQGVKFNVFNDQVGQS